MKQATINLYEFAELSQKAQQKAIYDHIEFMDRLPEESEKEDGTMISEYIEHSEEDAKDSIKANEYLFYADGTFANCVTYCGAHPLAGITELKFHGEVYRL